jgi:hypothetical protein
LHVSTWTVRTCKYTINLAQFDHMAYKEIYKENKLQTRKWVYKLLQASPRRSGRNLLVGILAASQAAELEILQELGVFLN